MDHGIGISKESQENVFERFYRVSGPENQSFPGLGLGLYISREIIQRQGGKIWVESEKNNGSTFCFCLSTDFRKALPQDLNKQLTIKNA
jgi:signal transduction histidine kinase